LSLYFRWYLANHGAKDGVQMATPIGIMLQRSILYTLASFGSYYSPTLSICAYMQAFKNQTLSTYEGEANATNSNL
jgi:hypothetical protein